MRLITGIISLVKEAEKDELFSLAGQLTYKMLMAFFPFLVFVISSLAFLNLNGEYWISTLTDILPSEAGSLLSVFFNEVINTPNVGVLSVSLLISLYNASSGFYVVIKCVNQTYGYKDCRNFFLNQLISLCLVLIFTLSLASMLILMIFNNNIFDLYEQFFPHAPNAERLFQLTGFIITMGILLLATMIIYKLANCRHPKFKKVLPGALVAVGIWVIASEGFSIYVNNFAKFSKIYGSIAGVFILITWLNIISTTLLLGSEINSMLDH
ncbi:MAG: YihY/virulence factor BrkB family protein [Clostridiales bacterium]|jgi:membrane protein|nr:YihY/virulence factor BrkB family protein [Clostridiales bacterium]